MAGTAIASEWFGEHFGVDLELRAEGALAVDPDDELPTRSSPAEGGLGTWFCSSSA